MNVFCTLGELREAVSFVTASGEPVRLDFIEQRNGTIVAGFPVLVYATRDGETYLASSFLVTETRTIDFAPLVPLGDCPAKGWVMRSRAIKDANLAALKVRIDDLVARCSTLEQVTRLWNWIDCQNDLEPLWQVLQETCPWAFLNDDADSPTSVNSMRFSYHTGTGEYAAAKERFLSLYAQWRQTF